MEIFGFSEDQVMGATKSVVDPRWGFTPREALQKLGTEAVQAVFGKNVWVDSAKARYDTCCTDYLIYTDVRFPAEAEWIHANGGLLVRVDRQIPVTLEDWHVSETALAGYLSWDLIIKNTGTKEELIEQLRPLTQ